jgi:hypothetical protein
MGKKARLKAKRLAESQGAKKLIEQIHALDQEIAQSEAELAALEGQKSQMLADILTESPSNRSMSLGEILTPEQIHTVIEIFRRPNLDDIAQTKLIKQYLAKFSRELQAVGVVPDYLAYVLLANKQALLQMAEQQPDDDDEPGLPPVARN